MAQATLSDMTQPTPNTDVERAIDWLVNDSVATAYNNGRLGRFDETNALEFNADWGTIPESEQVTL